MVEALISEIRLMSCGFAPKGWAPCDGQLLLVVRNQSLYSLLGDAFGGDGRHWFALPDLRGRVPIHAGSRHALGERGGEQAHALSIAELPEHAHAAHATSQTGTTPYAPGNLLAQPPSQLYAAPEALVSLSPTSIASTGASRAHLNMQPFLALGFYIALEGGYFPSRDSSPRPGFQEPYIGEIKLFAGDFAPLDWMFCEGQLLPISEHETLFQVIGTTFGGDGESTFALPDLRGRLPLGQGDGFGLAQTGGAEEATLTVDEVAAHAHELRASTSAGNRSSPAGNVLAWSTAAGLYVEDAATVGLDHSAVGPAGGSQPHANLQPYLCVGFIISLVGIVPRPSHD